MRAPFPSGKPPTTRVRRRISRPSHPIVPFARMRPRRPFPVGRRRPGGHAAHETHHAPPASRVRKHGADGGDESRAPPARHGPHALQAAFDHATKEPPQPAGSPMPPSTAMTSRRPSASIPTATSMPTFPTYPPRERLRYTPSMNTYGYSDSNGRLRHSSISSYTLLSLSLNVCEGMRHTQQLAGVVHLPGGQACRVYVGR